jgi:DNA-binding XRE family transcriptional regulator
MPDRDLTKLSPGENLWMARQLAGLTQAAYAARLGVSRNTLAAAERDGPKGRLRGAATVKTRPATPWLCALARRREGLGLRGTAEAMGLSHTRLLQLDHLGGAWLVGWWEGRGYIFSRQK